ncbi:hypothetical protein HZA98_02305 [Candidatus Woesearchaeota archaeon]|nr:hypothetical protein [Candidatus Woesearchaeota archaeon]
MNIFEIQDKTGRIIYLTEERWVHILKHPEMQDSLDKIEKTLAFPQSLTPHSYDKNIRNYYFFVKENRKFLKVIVKYLNGKGFVITAYIVEKIQ